MLTSDMKLYIYNLPLTQMRTPIAKLSQDEKDAERIMMNNHNFSMYREKMFYTL